MSTFDSQSQPNRSPIELPAAAQTTEIPVSDSPRHRSGVVAQMLQMPVATLRVWERRYGVTQPELSPSGHRLYSAGDVQRLALVKRLTDLGHAISSLASLDLAQLLRVASTRASAQAATSTQPDEPTHERLPSGQASPVRAWRLAVIGVALGARLQRPALLRRLGRPVELLGPFAGPQQAAAALQNSAVDALLIHAPQLHEGWLAELRAAAPASATSAALSTVPTAVLYGFAAEAACEALATAGMALMRDPQSDTVLAQWLLNLCVNGTGSAPAALPTTHEFAPANAAVPPRRWDDAALMEFAAHASTVACECPRHVVELLMQLAQFEAYSAGCESRSVSDAQLHTCLQQVAGASRVGFEAALEQVALHEGRRLPTASPPRAADDATVTSGHGQTTTE